MRLWRRVLSFAAGALALVLVAVLVALWLTSAHFAAFGGRPSAASLSRMAATGHYGGGHFVNEDPTTVMKASLASTLGDWLFGKEMRAPTCPLPIVTTAAAVLAAPPASGLRATWLGHSTVLIEIDGVRVLTDPIWSERASPTTLAGPKRFHPPPLPFEALPAVDAVIVSHDHYDHCDMATLQKLAARGVVIHLPLGIGGHLERWGVPAAQIVEHDRWQRAELPNGVALVSTPARHFSGRGLLRDETWWTSWSIVGPVHRVFFSGDTGLTPGFSAIADAMGPFDLSLLEIGQYHPGWGEIHLGPRGALEAHRMLRAKKLLPIHWSTFQLGYHDWSEPAETLAVEAEKQGLAILTPRLGEPVEPDADGKSSPWWRALPPIAASCP